MVYMQIRTKHRDGLCHTKGMNLLLRLMSSMLWLSKKKNSIILKVDVRLGSSLNSVIRVTNKNQGGMKGVTGFVKAHLLVNVAFK